MHVKAERYGFKRRSAVNYRQDVHFWTDLLWTYVCASSSETTPETLHEFLHSNGSQSPLTDRRDVHMKTVTEILE